MLINTKKNDYSINFDAYRSLVNIDEPFKVPNISYGLEREELVKELLEHLQSEKLNKQWEVELIFEKTRVK